MYILTDSISLELKAQVQQGNGVRNQSLAYGLAVDHEARRSLDISVGCGISIIWIVRPFPNGAG
jgi:hypothetical protein